MTTTKRALLSELLQLTGMFSCYRLRKLICTHLLLLIGICIYLHVRHWVWGTWKCIYLREFRNPDAQREVSPSPAMALHGLRISEFMYILIKTSSVLASSPRSLSATNSYGIAGNFGKHYI